MNARPELVDFHCHLDLYPDFEAVFAECEKAQVYTLAVTTTPRAWKRNRELAAALRYVRVALGLHPQVVADRSYELAQWREYLDDTRYVGEIGLDAGPRFFAGIDLQRQIFVAILQACAERGGKILSVHSIRSAKLVLDLIEQHLPPTRGRVVLHWFTGTRSEARRAVDLGCYFSINAQMLRTSNHEALVRSLPEDRVLTETDGPFTSTPTGAAARPVDVWQTVDLLARVRGSDPSAMRTIIRSNLRALLST